VTVVRMLHALLRTSPGCTNSENVTRTAGSSAVPVATVVDVALTVLVPLDWVVGTLAAAATLS
jgi:hypothetical protein